VCEVGLRPLKVTLPRL